MKKFWVGLLSTIILLGGSILSACGSPTVTIDLDKQHVDICLNDDSEHKALISATVNGIDEGRVTASSSYENIASASVVYNSITGKNDITINAIAEGDADIIITSDYDSSVKTIVSVTVYSEVKSMTQKDDSQTGQSKMYAIRGGTVTLDDKELITVYPATARRNITWSFAQGVDANNATLVGNTLTLTEGFVADNEGYITLIATAESGESTQVKLFVLNALSASSIKMEYSYSLSQDFTPLDSETISIVPNISTDSAYTAYIRFRYNGNEPILPQPVVLLNGKEDIANISILKQSQDEEEGYLIYEVKALKTNVNGAFTSYFNVGYAGYDYAIKSNSFNINCYEKIRDINLYTEENSNAASSVQSIYTTYASPYGAKYRVELTPTGVHNATGKYSLSVDYNNCNSRDLQNNNVNKDTLQFYYRNMSGSYGQIFMGANSNSDLIFDSIESTLTSSTELYILASEEFVNSSISNVKLTLRSIDNPNVSSVYTLNLYKSASNIKFEEYEGFDASLRLSTMTTSEEEKIFVLRGQTSIEGLMVETIGEGFTASSIEPIGFTTDADGSVTFRVKFKVDANSIGLTKDCSYRIRHKNGLSSDTFDVKLFLPLTDARIDYESSSAVTKAQFNNNLYILNDGALENATTPSASVSSLLVRTGSSVPLTFIKNRANGNYADARIRFSFLDYDESADLDVFLGQTANDIYNNPARKASSSFVNVTTTSLTTTNRTGYTYLVVSFTGLDTLGNEVTFVRIVLIENYVAPTEFSVNPTFVNLYAYDSVSTKDREETKAEVRITLSEVPLTYSSLDYFTFYSNRMGGAGTMLGDNVTWAEGYYNISNIVLTDTYLSFVINGLSTKGVQNFDDVLTIRYYNTDKQEVNVNPNGVVNVKIVNADRIESLVWENEAEGGIYFEVNDTEPSILVISSAPSNAKTKELYYHITDKAGNPTPDNFVEVKNVDNNGQVVLTASEGKAGYIYVLPQDAINQGRIFYFDKLADLDGLGNPISQNESLDNLGKIKEGTTTWFDYLYENAYFISNKNEEIPFSNILIRISVMVADGSRDYEYHIYSEEDFKTKFESNKYYRVMNNITLDSWTSIENLTGGIRGDNENITITINGESFVNTNHGTISDITFTGNVAGGGFVANSNYGTIENVIIDVNAEIETDSDTGISRSVYKPSTLDGTTKTYVGGVVGENFASLSNVKVLGLKIVAGTTGSYVGGFAGKNEGGNIKGSSFEIYNFETGANTITGEYVGGFVGYLDGGNITESYIYDYTMTENSGVNLVGSHRSAFVGFANSSVNVTKSFAVVNIEDRYFTTSSGVFSQLDNTYISYYSYSGYVSDFYINGMKNDNEAALSLDIWAKPNNPNSSSFMAYVNGGMAHLKNVYQAEPLTNVSGYEVVDVLKEGNNVYKALKVGASEAILFRYAVDSRDYAFMTDNEKRALESLNTISLASLLDSKDADRLVVGSADTSIVDINANSIVVKDTGVVTLTISSKQDYSLNKTITVYVINALSDLSASWAYQGGSENITNGSVINLQRGRSLTVSYNFEHTSMYLGNRGNAFDLIPNEYELNHVPSSNTIIVETTGTNKTILNLVTNKDSENAEINTYVRLLGLDEQVSDVISDVIRTQFAKNYSLNLFDGAISIGATNNEVSITPSSMGVVRVQLISGAKDDVLTPNVKLMLAGGSVDLSVVNDNGTWTASRDKQEQILIQIVPDAGNESAVAVDGLYTLNFTVYLSVVRDYRAEISETQTYNISLSSLYQVVEEDFDLIVSRQEFTNIAISNYRVNNMLYEKIGGYGEDRDVYVNKYEVSNATSGILAPGSSSLLKVNVNPQYAYYHHFTMEYSGASMIGAATINFMTQDIYGRYYEDTKSQVDLITNGISVIPSGEAKENYDLYFKIWANNAIQQKDDVALKFTIRFYDSNGEEITYANYNLTISYLAEPQVLVDGYSTAILAKGQTAEVKIVVPADQNVDINSTIVENVVSGITLFNTNWEIDDSNAGVVVYTSRISASINAKLKDDANGMFRISVTVSRTSNGYEERKTAYAEVNLVDFKVDADNISIANSENDTFVTYLGLSEPLQFKYPILPENYTYDPSDQESVDNVNAIKANINSFERNSYFKDEDAGYYINYARDNNGNPIPSQPKTVNTRLDYYSNVNNNWMSVYNGREYSSVGGYLEWTYNERDNILFVKGLRPTTDNAPIALRLQTTVQVGETYNDYYYYFNVLVKVYSDEDTPLLVYSEDDFMDMAEGDAQNYILMNDIVLRNYTPIDTNAIASLDGNGYTIYIDWFNPNPEDTASLNFALFNNVASTTTLKNIRVNVYNGGQITVNVANPNYSSINIAGLAITNNGIITNCEVVSFQKNGVTGAVINGDTGIVVKYVRGEGVTEPEYMSDPAVSNVAGFVITNNGSITNSRVGGSDVYTIGENYTDSQGQTIGYFLDKTYLEKFNIIAQGNIAGFVLENAGTIASSFVKNFGMQNQTASTRSITAGFVANNNSQILTSYVEGVKEDKPKDVFCRQGSSLSSSLGKIAGFVYQNDGKIQDAYSNILISNTSNENQAYLVSGFVYENTGILENCFSASQITSLVYSQMNFSGVDEKGNLLATGSYINCYYYNAQSLGNDDSTEESYNTRAVQLSELDDETYFYGFAFNSSENSINGVWSLIASEGILTLVEPNKIAYSSRYYLAGEEEGQYFLPYSTLYNSERGLINANYGSENNPIIIRNAQEFVNVTGRSTSTYISSYFTKTRINGNYRIVSDLDFSDLVVSGGDNEEEGTIDLPSINKAFTGNLFGNGFTISNLSITSSEDMIAFGLFASIEGASIINLNITVNQVVNNLANFVGSVAGYAKNSNLVNIQITNNKDCVVEGLNFVGGVVGMMFGDSKVKNVNVIDPNVIADRYNEAGIESQEGATSNIGMTRNVATFSAQTAFELRMLLIQQIGDIFLSEANVNMLNNVVAFISNMSYAGGAFGYVDIFTEQESMVADYQHKTEMQSSDYELSKVRVQGAINVQGQVVGGVVGFAGVHTDIKDTGAIFTDPASEPVSHLVATKFYAGGIVGQGYGNYIQLFSEYDEATQNTIENNLLTYYSGSNNAERGSTTIFSTEGIDKDYSQIYVGGLVGYAGSGQLTVSYSKLNVVDMLARYAGGVIGYVNTTNSSVYYISDGTDNIVTKYYMNEVYATGDVRAKNAAGGIIGSVSRGSNIILESVNAVNFLSTYDYAEEVQYRAEDFYMSKVSTDLDENEQPIEYNIYSFDKINVYAIIGNYENQNDFNFLVVTKAADDDETAAAGTKRYVTVGAVRQYVSSINMLDTIKLFAYPNEPYRVGDINVNEEGNLHNIMAIPSVSTYPSAETGYDDTYGVFLGSDVWSMNNWYHDSDSLYPRIKFSIVERPYIYLDAYDASIRAALTRMQNSDIEVRVRGLTAAGSETKAHIDIAGFLQRNDITFRDGIENFRGRLIGWQVGQQVSIQGYPQEWPALLLDRPLFNGTAAGFRMSNVSVKFRPYNDPVRGEITNNTIFSSDNDYHGAFSGSNMMLAVLDNVQFEFTHNVYFYDQNKDREVGLLAPTITNTSISNFNIFINLPESGQVFLSTDATRVGLIAGKATQNSENRIMNIQNVNIYNYTDASGNLINNSNTSNSNVYIGAYFGEVLKSGKDDNGNDLTPTKLNIQIGKVGNTYTQIQGNDWKGITQLNNVSETINVNYNHNNIYIGGYAGLASNIDAVTFADIDTVTNISLSLSGNTSSGNTSEPESIVYAGGLFGAYKGSGINIAGKTESVPTKTFNVRIYSSSDTNKDVYLGGLVGQMASDGTPEISNVVTNFEVFKSTNVSGRLTSAYHNSADIMKNYIDNLGNTFAFNAFEVNENAYVGGLVGRTTGNLAITSDEEILRYNNPYKAISVRAEENAYVGGLVGRSEKDLTIKGIIRVGSVLNVNAGFEVSSTEVTKAYVGGLVGDILLPENATANIAKDGLTYADMSFVGQIYTSHKASIGGIVGRITGLDESQNIYIKDTAFGGAIKIYNAEDIGFDIGGLVGTFASIDAGGTDAKASRVEISNNYTFGDVFFLYKDEKVDSASTTEKTFPQHGQVIYGGLIGNGLNVSGLQNPIQDNYIMTTYNDQCPNAGDLVHAVFGSIQGLPNEAGNFYSHAVALTTDNFAYDAGYMTPYAKNKNITGGGYTGHDYWDGMTDKQDKALAEFILERVSNVTALTGEGSKLNPKSFTGAIATEEIDQLEKVHGMRYYYFSADNAQAISMDSITNTLDNVAIIGDGYTINYTNKNASPIEYIKGQSFVSGLNIVLDIDNDNVKTGKTERMSIGGVASYMESGIIYAVGVSGSMSVGGNTAISLGGLVGSMANGLITESVSDVHIIYRAGQKKDGGVTLYGQASAIANVNKVNDKNINNVLVTYTYAVGIVESYIDTHIDGFIQGRGEHKETEVEIRYSYSATNLNWHDHTSSNTEPDSSHRTVFGNDKDAKLTDTYNDKNANGIGSTTTACIKQKFNAGNWVQDDKFNYSYPTRQFNYLKYSSYASRGDKDTDLSDDTKGIERYEYNRLTGSEIWGEKPVDLANGYYIVPNAGVFDSYLPTVTDGITENKKLIIRNDFDFSYFSTNNTVGPFAETAKLDLDGQGHRIYNFQGTGLFQSLTNSFVINVDILDVTISNGTTNTGVIAGTITNTTISNVTLSGTITISADNNSGQYGGVAGTATNSTITSVMSNLKVDTNKRYVGGVVGYADSTTIKYSSNNGPINTINKDKNRNIYTGGIVAYMINNSKVLYCYNTSSVTSGFVITEAVAINYAGGIAGRSDSSTIEYCYNSGLVKAGNKKCTTAQYAGGIVGYSDGGTVSNSLNEAAVEAVATNSEFKIRTNKTANEKIRTFTIYTESSRNVYAYGVGYNGSEGIADSNYNTNEEIVMNGCAIKGDITSGAGYTMDISKYPANTNSFADGWGRNYRLSYESYFKDGANDDNNNFVITSRDEFGFPTSLYIKLLHRVVINEIIKESSRTKYSKDLEDYYSWTSDSQTPSYRSYVADKYNFYGNKKASDSGDVNKIKNMVLSETKSNNKNTNILINNKYYYLANEAGSDLYNLMNSALVYTTTYTTSDPTIIDLFDKGDYSYNNFNFDYKDDSGKIFKVIGTGWNKIGSGSNAKVVFDLSIYATEEINNWADKKLSISYSLDETYTIDLTNYKYSYYEEDGRIEIDISDNTYTALIETIFDNSSAFGYQTKLNDSDEEFINAYYTTYQANGTTKELYFVYGNKSLVLYKNLKLYNSDGNVLNTVNTSTLLPEMLAGKSITIHYGLTIESTFTVDAPKSSAGKVSDSYTGNKNISNSEKFNSSFTTGGNGNIVASRVPIDFTYSILDTANNITAPIIKTEFDEENITDRITSFEINVSGNTDMKLGNIAVFKAGVWSSEIENFDINGINMTITSNGETLIIVSDVYADDDIQSEIENYLNTLTLTYDSISIQGQFASTGYTATVTDKDDNKLVVFDGANWTKVNDLIIDSYTSTFADGVWSFENVSADDINSILNYNISAYSNTASFTLPDASSWDKALFYIGDSPVVSYNAAAFATLGNLQVSIEDNKVTVTSLDFEKNAPIEVDYFYQLKEIVLPQIIVNKVYNKQFSNGILSGNITYNFVDLAFEENDVEFDVTDNSQSKIHTLNMTYALGKVNSKSTNGIIVYYGTFNFNSNYNVNYTASNLDVTITNNNDEDSVYMKTEFSGLSLVAGDAEVELQHNTTNTLTFSVDSDFSIQSNIYHTHFEVDMSVDDEKNNVAPYFESAYDMTFNITGGKKYSVNIDGKMYDVMAPSFIYNYNLNADGVTTLKSITQYKFVYTMEEIREQVDENGNKPYADCKTIDDYIMKAIELHLASKDLKDKTTEEKLASVTQFVEKMFEQYIWTLDGNIETWTYTNTWVEKSDNPHIDEDGNEHPNNITHTKEYQLASYNRSTKKWTVYGSSNTYNSIEEAIKANYLNGSIDITKQQNNIDLGDYTDKVPEETPPVVLHFTKEDFVLSGLDIVYLRNGENTSKIIYLDSPDNIDLSLTLESNFKFDAKELSMDSNLAELNKVSQTLVYEKSNLTFTNLQDEAVDVSDLTTFYNYDSDSNSLTFNYKPNGEDKLLLTNTMSGEISGFIASQENDNAIAMPILPSGDSISYEGIILTRNMYLGKISYALFSGRLSGNDYVISYHSDQSSLFDSTTDGAFMKDLSVVGQLNACNVEEVKDKAVGNTRYYATSIISNYNKATINNVSTYGNVRNAEFRKYDQYIASGFVGFNEGALNNVRSFVTINGITSTGRDFKSTITTGIFYKNETATIDNLTNYGLLIGGNGYNEISNGRQGGQGSNVYAIGFETVKEVGSNSQYVIAGNGGSSFVGKNGNRGQDILSNSTSSGIDVTKIAGKNGGVAVAGGENGTAYLYGTKSLNSYLKKGKVGQKASAGNGGMQGWVAIAGCVDSVNVGLRNAGYTAVYLGIAWSDGPLPFMDIVATAVYAALIIQLNGFEQPALYFGAEGNYCGVADMVSEDGNNECSYKNIQTKQIGKTFQALPTEFIDHVTQEGMFAAGVPDAFRY